MGFRALEKALLNTTLSTFGEPVTYNYMPEGTSSQINGVFSVQQLEVNQVQMYAPSLSIALNDLTREPGKRDTVVVRDVTYKVVQSQIDSLGGSVLVLQVHT